jgi:hypothetical protein
MVKPSCCGVTENRKEQERQSGSKDAVYEWKIDMPRRDTGIIHKPLRGINVKAFFTGIRLN